MAEGIKIVKSGFFTTIQDRGRLGYAHLGVPESGAMDQGSYDLANRLLNNECNAAMLECTIIGPCIEFLKDVYFTITGANSNPILDGIQIKMNIPILGRKGQILSLSKLTKGIRSYIAFAGGLESDITLGSRSWCKPITKENKLSKDDLFNIGISKYGGKKGGYLKYNQEPFPETSVLVAHPGPEYNSLTVGQQKLLEERTFTVSALWNRMAIQLEESVTHKLENIMTSPVIPGTIQLTPSGKLIVLTRDCQTTGGYPRVLQLNAISLNQVAQIQQGDKILFTIA